MCRCTAQSAWHPKKDIVTLSIHKSYNPLLASNRDVFRGERLGKGTLSYDPESQSKIHLSGLQNKNVKSFAKAIFDRLKFLKETPCAEVFHEMEDKGYFDEIFWTAPLSKPKPVKAADLGYTSVKAKESNEWDVEALILLVLYCHIFHKIVTSSVEDTTYRYILYWGSSTAINLGSRLITGRSNVATFVAAGFKHLTNLSIQSKSSVDSDSLPSEHAYGKHYRKLVRITEQLKRVPSTFDSNEMLEFESHLSPTEVKALFDQCYIEKLTSLEDVAQKCDTITSASAYGSWKKANPEQTKIAAKLMKRALST
jgi:hypothetical protein